jgi:hypothetical protein
MIEKMRMIISLVGIMLLAGAGSAQIEATSIFSPSGTIGDYGDVGIDEASAKNPHSPPSCIELTYSAAQSQGAGYAGLCWQYPDSNLGDQPGYNLEGMTRLTFFAKGSLGGENAEFFVGGGRGDSLSPSRSTGTVTLSQEWQQYSIDVSGADMSSVVSGFCWRSEKGQNPLGCTIYIDDVFYE